VAVSDKEGDAVLVNEPEFELALETVCETVFVHEGVSEEDIKTVGAVTAVEPETVVVKADDAVNVDESVNVDDALNVRDTVTVYIGVSE
jgi:hypothetical protein